MISHLIQAGLHIEFLLERKENAQINSENLSATHMGSFRKA